jgi:hypothetical protein
MIPGIYIRYFVIPLASGSVVVNPDFTAMTDFYPDEDAQHLADWLNERAAGYPPITLDPDPLVTFDQPYAWISLTPDSARQLADWLVQAADTISETPESPTSPPTTQSGPESER